MAKTKNNKMANKQAAPISSYKVNRNNGPLMTGKGQHCVIRHTELVRGLAFENDIRIFRTTTNPGNGLDFPWLTNIAKNFEKYRFKKLTYRLVSYMPTTSSGHMGMYYDYDPVDSYPVDEAEFYSNQDAQVASSWGTMKLDVKVPTTEFFIRGDGEADQPAKWYDTGVLFYFTQSSTSGGAGLFVDYEVELIKPQGVRRVRAVNGFATWTALSPTQYPNEKPQISSGLLFNEDGQIRLTEVGWYKCTVTTNSSYDGDQITNVLGNVVQSDPIIQVSSSKVLSTQTFIIYRGPETLLQYNDAFTLGTGQIDTTGYTSEGPTPVSISIEYLRDVPYDD
nr:structural protein [Tolivirales sp. gcode 6]